MEKTATLHSRTFATNVPSVTESGTSWNTFVTKQNPDLYTPPKPDPNYYPYTMHRDEVFANVDPLPPPPPASSSSPSRDPSSPSSASSTDTSLKERAALAAHKRDVELAFGLVQGLLEPESCKRTTPKDALSHPFLLDPDEPGDEELFPHPFGQGVCWKYHFVDEVTEEPGVKVYEPARAGHGVRRLGTKRLAPGQGIAIGKQPCEFHKDTELYC